MTHTFTVTRMADDPNADTEDPEYTIGGTHDGACSVWYPCKVEGCEADDDGVFHGVYHQSIGGIDDFCTQGDECGLDYAFEYDNPEWQMTRTGIADADLEWDGDAWIATLHNWRDLDPASSDSPATHE